MSRYRPVDAAMKRRVDAGACPICGGKMIEPKVHIINPKGLPKICINSQDGRHGGAGGRRIRLK